jgi:hypothetical protein
MSLNFLFLGNGAKNADVYNKILCESFVLTFEQNFVVRSKN